MHTCCAEVDTGNLSLRPAQGMFGRLRCSAARNQDGVVFPARLIGPEQVIVRAASLPVLPELSIFSKAVDRPRIGIPFIEVPDFIRSIK